MITDTIVLVATVVTGAIVLGVSLAWLVSAYEFPFRRVIGWLLVTPLAIPGYVGGFVWLHNLTGVFGARDVRSIWICAGVLILSLYPYVYLFARAAFADQSADTIAAARSLGRGPLSTFLHISLPTARPAIAAGAALVAMEVLTDIGTVRLFNVSTLADGVLRVWFGTGDRNAATEVASALTGAAILLIASERLLRRRGQATRGSGEAAMRPQRLSLVGTLAAIGAPLAVITIAVGVPVTQLVSWTIETIRADNAMTVAGGIRYHVTNSIMVTAIAAFACLCLGTILAVTVAHRGRMAHVVARISTVGYAMPGPVVAVGAVVTLAAIDRWDILPSGFFLVGSVLGLVFALVVRFLAVGYQGIEASLDKVPRTAVESARVLGAGPLRTALTVELPAARFGIIAAAALLSVDVVKELPITLLLRPFGVDTLSVWVWQATSESLWEQAAVPSLFMIMIGMLAVGALLYALERGAKVVS
jgi:iron(III) transport system permease protein